MDKVNIGKNSVLKLQILRNDPVKEEWEDIYSKVGVYETRCKGWKDPSFIAAGNAKYCEFDTKKFLFFHALLIGFFYDLGLPFMAYNDQVYEETRKPLAEKTTKEEQLIVSKKSEIAANTIRITVNKKSSTSTILNGEAQFDFKALGLKPDDLPTTVTASIEFNEKSLDISDVFESMVATLNSQKKNMEAQRIAEAQRPENKFKMKFCSKPDLFEILFVFPGTSLESNCIYGLGRAPLQVIQSINGGISVSPRGMSPHIADKVIFIKTKKQFVDQDLIQNIYLKSTGVMKYTNVMGAEKTINAFHYLGDVN